MKVYLNDDKTHVDPPPHNAFSEGWKPTVVGLLSFKFWYQGWKLHNQVDINVPSFPLLLVVVYTHV